MRPVARFAFAMVLAWCAPLWFSTPARADTSVASLGVRSLDGDSDLERRLSNALRASAGSIAGWSVGKRDASLEQMMLAIGCEEPDAPCLAEVAKTLAVQRLVFGSVTNAGGGYELTVNQYDTADRQLHTASARGLRQAQLRGPSGKESVLALLAQLNQVEAPPPAPTTGTLRVHADMPNAQIAVDGETVGSLDERGVLSLELPAGKHVVRAAGQAFAPAEEKLAVVEVGQTTQLELSIKPVVVDEEPPPPAAPPEVETAPQARPKHTLRRVFGWTSLGLGAAFAVATIYSWVRIERINDDPDFLAYRGAFPRAGSQGGVGNVCPRAARGELAREDSDRASLERRANDLCSEADTLQALQYVFLGGALVGAGVGTYLLVSARRMERAEAQPPSLSIAPRFGFQSASLEARLRF
jgi:hypothetical protein